MLLAVCRKERSAASGLRISGNRDKQLITRPLKRWSVAESARWPGTNSGLLVPWHGRIMGAEQGHLPRNRGS